MMQSEWTKLTGHNPSDFEWGVIHTVYQFHPTIPDLGGKEKLAQLFALGGFGLMTDMQRAAREFAEKGEEESKLLAERMEIDSRLEMVRFEMATMKKVYGAHQPAPAAEKVTA